MPEGSPSPDPARDRLALALDVDDLVPALRLARQLSPWFSVAKVGLELFSAAGPEAVGALIDLGYDVFADLKYHDIPTTVGRAARVTGALGARYLNFHAQGGAEMLRAGVDGFRAGADDAGLPDPVALAVTVLTSEPEAPPGELSRRVRTAVEAGCGGVVCAAADIALVREDGPGLLMVVPGIRLAGTDHHDHGRPSTPGPAVAAGAGLLVVGRTVTAAPDPAAAAARVHAEVVAALENRPERRG